jgi:hypothetical protein
MTFSLLRHLAGTRGLDAKMQRCHSECFLLGCVCTDRIVRASGAPPPNHFGTNAIRARHLCGA